MIGSTHLFTLPQTLPLKTTSLAGLVGLVPNCASSVVLTKLYLSGALGPGAAMAGLLANSGLGLLVLFRVNRNRKENIGIVAGLYLVGVTVGIPLELLF